MNKMVKAVFTLTAFSVLDRIFGFLFKIYLSNEMGPAALGAYQVAISFFMVLLTLVSSGLPLIIGKLTAANEARGDKNAAHALVSAGLVLNFIFSVALVILTAVFAPQLRQILSSGGSLNALFILLPSLVFCALGSAFRGNLWGRENYFTVSVIELSEQVVRILLCVALFFMGASQLPAAAFSLSAAMIFSSALTAVCYFARGGRLSNPKGRLRELLLSSAPISGLRAASSLIGSIQAVVIPLLFVSSGLSTEQALYWFGVTVGMSFPLLFLPITVVGSLAYAMIPALSKAAASGSKTAVSRQIEGAIRFSVIAAAIFIPLYVGLGHECSQFIYNNADAGRFLALGGVLLVPISLESIVSSMMNSLGMEKQGFVSYCVGSLVTFGVMFCFFGRFSADVLCWSIFAGTMLSAVIDIALIKRRTGISLEFILLTAKAAALAVPCTALAAWSYTLFAFCPELVSIMLAALLGCGSLLFLYIAFEIISPVAIFRSGAGKKPLPSLKRLQNDKKKYIILKTNQP